VQAEFAAPVAGLIGGLHYGNADAAALLSEIQLVQGLNPEIVSLSPHDSGPAALEAFARAFSAAYQPIRVGEPIQIQ
jgi:metal-dependent hydrolase (beta-lactamase superfamily II)